MSKQDMLQDALEAIENRIEDQLDRLNNLKSSDLIELRGERLKHLQQKAEQEKEWRRLGHGTVCELQDEKDFFQISKQSRKCVILVYSDDFNSIEGKILQEHLKKIAPKVLELKMATINSKHCPYLMRQLNIISTPLLLLIKDNTLYEKITQFDPTLITSLSPKSTESLLYRLSLNGFIDNEDLIPAANESYGTTKKSIFTQRRKVIRTQDSDESDDWDV